MGHIEAVLVIEQGRALGTSPAWAVKKFWPLRAAMSPGEGLRAVRVPGVATGPSLPRLWALAATAGPWAAAGRTRPPQVFSKFPSPKTRRDRVWFQTLWPTPGFFMAATPSVRLAEWLMS